LVSGAQIKYAERVSHATDDTKEPVVKRRNETAKQMMTCQFLSATPTETVNVVRRRLAQLGDSAIRMVYVTDEMGQLQSVISLRELVTSRRDIPIVDLAGRCVASVAPDLDQEAVAAFALKTRQDEVPVVDKSGRLIGIIPPLALIDTLQHEHDEDVHRLAGILHPRDPFRKALKISILTKVRYRLPWLFAGLGGCLLSALLVAGYEDNIKTQVAIAFFIPAIVYIADAIGTQTEAIVVRGLSHGDLPLTSIFMSETSTGFVVGTALGVIALPAIVLVFGETMLAIVVALSIACAGAVASAVGLLLPWILSKRGLDPAYGSGPMATIIQDLLSISIYFGIGNTLL
jgi:magnesium transporter